MKVSKKISKQQKRILSLLAAEEMRQLPISHLYARRGKVRSVRASLSRAISRLQDRGLVERAALLIGDRKVPAVRLTG